VLIVDELFDFDETIPSIGLELDMNGVKELSQASSPGQTARSPLFVPPLSPFRRRSIEKYDLPGDDNDPFDELLNIPSRTNGVQFKDDLPSLSSSKPIAITPPPRSLLAKHLGVDEDEDEGGMKGLIERISLKNTRSGLKSSFSDQRMLWDIPGDYYRSVPF
jgi:hypothetical protein